MPPTTTTSPKYSLSLSDWQKGLLMAIGVGIVLPLSVVVQGSDFDFFSANWYHLLDLALTGAFTGGVVYLAKNYFSDSNGKFLGTSR